MTPGTRQHLWLAVRILVSALCVAYVVWRVDFLDRVQLSDGTTVRGWIVRRGPDSVTIRPSGAEPVTYPLDQVHVADEATGARFIAEGFGHVFTNIVRGGGWPWFIAAALAYALSPVFGAWRWRMLLRVQGIRLTFGEAWRLTYIGFFFNTFMLGVTGGDVVKAYYAARHTHRKTEAVTTVFFDRLVGILGMALLCVCALVVKWRAPALGEVRWVIFVFLGGAALMATLMYSRRLRRWSLLRRLADRLPFRAFFSRLSAAVLLYRYHHGKVLLAIVLSWCAHVVSIASVYLSARALGLDPLPTYFFIYMPVIWIVAAVFPSVGALGVIEGLSQRYFTADVLGVPTAFEALAFALAMALVFRAAMFAAVLPGGVLNVLHPEVSIKEAREHIDDEAEAHG